jgi:replicative DNA helicase
MNIEATIVQHLICDVIYFSRVFSNLDSDIFSKIEHSEIFKHIKNYYYEYGNKPTPKELGLYLSGSTLTEALKKDVIQTFKSLYSEYNSNESVNVDFLVKKTEEYVKKQKFTNTLVEAAEALSKKENLDKFVDSFSKALNVSFETDFGTTIEDLSTRIDKYKTLVKDGIPIGIPSIDKMLGGGYRKKTLNVIASVTHGGKTLLMTHYTANATLLGKNGVYFTLELSEDDVFKRIDANILDIPLSSFYNTPRETFVSRYNQIKDKLGKLIVKEYPAGELNTIKIESFINKVYMQHGFYPDYICIDYLTGMSSIKVKPNIGLYSYFKFIAEELHALSKKLNIPVITAAQINRSGYNNTEAGLEVVSDSIGIAQTADTFLILTRTPEMDKVGNAKISFKKNRNTGMLYDKIIGMEIDKMRFYDIDIDENIEQNIVNNSFIEEKDMFSWDNV